MLYDGGHVVMSRVDLLRDMNNLIRDFSQAIVKKGPETLGFEIPQHQVLLPYSLRFIPRQRTIARFIHLELLDVLTRHADDVSLQIFPLAIKTIMASSEVHVVDLDQMSGVFSGLSRMTLAPHGWKDAPHCSNFRTGCFPAKVS
jgi:hypothetical protein